MLCLPVDPDNIENDIFACLASCLQDASWQPKLKTLKIYAFDESVFSTAFAATFARLDELCTAREIKLGRADFAY